jgi:hypothetical protein
MPATIETAIALGDGLELQTDGRIRRGERLAMAADVAPRTDLPRDHPLYGSRALRCVPSGWGDVVVGADSRPADAVAVAEPIGEEEVER